MKYRLTNKWGNVVRYVTTEYEKNRLVEQGFIIDETYGAKKTTVKRGNKENVGEKDKDRTETDI
jgi:hypothetical protein